MYNEGALLSRAAAAFSLSLRLWFVRRREAAVEALSVEAAEAVESPLLEAQGDGGRSVDIVPPTRGRPRKADTGLTAVDAEDLT